MKRTIVGLLALLTLAGAGCTVSQPEAAPSQTKATSAPAAAPSNGSDAHAAAYKAASDKSGFHIYYPTFLPSIVEWNDDLVYTKDSALAMFGQKGAGGLPMNTVTIQQYRSASTPNKLKERLEKLTDKKEITVGSYKGYEGYYENTSAKFYTVIFTTADGVDIGVWSKDYPNDVVKHVAESMK